MHLKIHNVEIMTKDEGDEDIEKFLNQANIDIKIIQNR